MITDKDIENMIEGTSFLPKDYDVPAGESGYMKFEEGENKFRILASPILGWEFWNDVDGGRKPVRFRMETQVPVEEVDNPEEGKHFWAMPVWNYKAKKVQILEITQKGIQRTLRAIARDKEWGSPLEYNLSVVRTGKGLETEYETIPSPPGKLRIEIKKAYKETSINLEALYDGDDPFKEG